MLTIRLSRVGKKKQPTYRFIVSEKTKDPWGDSLEILGHYNPRSNPATLVIKEDRLKHWVSKGAQLSDTVNNMLIDKGLIKGDKKRIVKMSLKKQAAMAEEKAKAAEAAKPKEEAPAPVVEATPEAAPEAPVETPAEPAAE